MPRITAATLDALLWDGLDSFKEESLLQERFEEKNILVYRILGPGVN